MRTLLAVIFAGAALAVACTPALAVDAPREPAADIPLPPPPPTPDV